MAGNRPPKTRPVLQAALCKNPIKRWGWQVSTDKVQRIISHVASRAGPCMPQLGSYQDQGEAGIPLETRHDRKGRQ